MNSLGEEMIFFGNQIKFWKEKKYYLL
jgi:hypothetical protein